METVTARVERTTDLTHDVRLIRLELLRPPTLPFTAGQFVSFSVEKPGLPHPLTRPYSIASSPAHPDRIELLFNRVPGGPGSGYLFSLNAGDTVTFRGAAGTFVLHPYADRRLLFVATGTGIAPIRSMLLARLPSPTPVTLVWGLRSERDLYFQDELSALTSRHPEFTAVTTLSQPSAEWRGARGRVQHLLEPEVTTVDDLAVYVCGGSAMTASVVALIRARGTCPIHRELYYKDPTAGTGGSVSDPPAP